jgi:predicted DNA-binding protein with PD1-like motif
MNYGCLVDNSYMLKLEPGEDIAGIVETFCNEKGIKNATVSGIGSVENPTLAHYALPRKQYSHKQLSGIYEITSLMGNVAHTANGPLVHIHVTITNDAMQASGGHLAGGTCSATCELLVTAYPSQFTKAHSEAIGLSVWDFPGR